LIGFVESSRDWLFHQNVYTGVKQSAGDFAVGFGRDRKTNSIDFADKRTPIRYGLSPSFRGHSASANLIKITDRHELAEIFSSQRCVQARMLRTEMSNSDNCSS